MWRGTLDLTPIETITKEFVFLDFGVLTFVHFEAKTGETKITERFEFTGLF